MRADAVASKVLCERHNSALSPLDDLARKYFEFALGRTKHWHWVIRGTGIERWLLKVMFGVVVSGYGQSVTGSLVTRTEPPLPLLQVLFGVSELPEKMGLVIPRRDGVEKSNELRVVILADRLIYGCVVSFSYVHLMLVLGPGPDLKGFHQRPSSVGYTLDDTYREVHLGWPNGEHVSLAWDTEKKADG